MHKSNIKLLGRIKIIWSLLFSSRYIDNLKNQIKTLSDEKEQLGEEYIKAAKVFKEFMAVLDPEAGCSFVNLGPHYKKEISLPYSCSPFEPYNNLSQWDCTYQVKTFTLQEAHRLYTQANGGVNTIKRMVIKDFTNFLFENGFIKVEYVGDPRIDQRWADYVVRIYYYKER